MKKRYFALMLLFAFAVCIGSVMGDTCNIEGYVYLNNGSAVSGGTNVNITNQGTGITISTVTGGVWPDPNYFFQAFSCTQLPIPDLFKVYSWIDGYRWGNGSAFAAGSVIIDITFVNNPPSFNASLPGMTMNEDNLTGIDNAIDLRQYTFDYEGTALTYSITSESNAALVDASIDGNYIDIAAPAANQNGQSTVCVRASDGEFTSGSSCFNIVVSPVQDLPVFTSASSNASATFTRGGSGIRVTTVASDVDAADTLILYVCSSPAVTAGGCTATTRCSSNGISNPSCTFTSESDDASHSWYAFIYDSSGGKAAGNFSGTYFTDATSPASGSVVVAGGATYSNSTTLQFAWSGFSDATSGIANYYYSFLDGSYTTSGTSAPNTSSSASLSGAAQGLVNVYVWARDNAGNIGPAATDWITVDTIAPVLSDWSEIPADLKAGYVGNFIVQTTVTDITFSPLNPPQFRFGFSSSTTPPATWYAWTNMVLVSGTTYRIEVSPPASTWEVYEGQYLFYQVRVSDQLSHSTTAQRYSFIDAQNYAPELDPLSNMVGTEDVNLSFIISATDDDADLLTFSSSYNFTFTRLSNSSANAWWVPDNSFVGSNSVTFTVRDEWDEDTQTITIDVSSVNDPPVLSPVGDLYGYFHIPFTHYIYGADIDNNNSITQDDDIVTFGNANLFQWFRINNQYNASSGQYYGVINFTPLLSHKGTHTINLYATDGTEYDYETINFIVGYCGDVDLGGEPRCDSAHEDCESCPKDCGACGEVSVDRLAIVVSPRNCLGRNVTFTTYRLYDRATCHAKGSIIDNYEVCGNISGITVKIYHLHDRKWEEVDRYVSDDDGVITFMPLAGGEYKLEASKKGFPNFYKYLEINPCLDGEYEGSDTLSPGQDKKNETGIVPGSATEKDKQTDTPGMLDDPDGEDITQASLLDMLLYFVALPMMAILFTTFSYYYYESHKNRSVWILKARIFIVMKKKKSVPALRKSWKKFKEFIGFG